jgi:hypothetical protein
MVTTSTDAPGNGTASAVPSSTSTAGRTSASWARMPGTGSTATTDAPSSSSRRVSFPVPAARSRTSAPGPIPTWSASTVTASSGYPGRAAS